jgi:hypothetical protein
MSFARRPFLTGKHEKNEDMKGREKFSENLKLDSPSVPVPPPLPVFLPSCFPVKILRLPAQQKS